MGTIRIADEVFQLWPGLAAEVEGVGLWGWGTDLVEKLQKEPGQRYQSGST